MDIAYYPGCSLKASSQLYDAQCKKVFSALGINLHEINDWNCCGATSAAKVDDFLAVALPSRNIGLADSSGYSEMLIPCSACYSKTLVAQKYLEKNADLKNRINEDLKHKITGNIKILSILELLTIKVRDGLLAAKAIRKIKGLNPVCYYGCMLTRFPIDLPVPDNVENPQSMELILESIGIHPKDWNYKTFCCGASAAINDETTSLNLMAKIIADAVDRGANCFVVTCPMCQLNLDAYQDKIAQKKGIAERLPVYFITELLGVAIGLSVNDLQIDRHFIDGTELLKQME